MKMKDIIKKTKKNSIKSLEMHLETLFEDENIFLIKEFQRKYNWKKLQIDDLFNEILENKSEDYFIGSIILKKESLKNNKSKINIVDGQQRITTLFLILKSIEMKLKNFKQDKQDEETIKAIQKIYIDNKSGRIKIDKLRGQKELENILIHSILFDEEDISNSEENATMIDNPIYTTPFKNIMSKMDNYQKSDIYNLIQKIKQIKFSVVILGNKINEYKVFEDLNSKGVDLKIDDLLRNFFAQKVVLFDKKNAKRNVDSYEWLIHDVEKFLYKEKGMHRGFFPTKWVDDLRVTFFMWLIESDHYLIEMIKECINFTRMQ